MFPNERRRHLSCYREVRDVRNSPASWGIFQCRHLTSHLTSGECNVTAVISYQAKLIMGLTVCLYSLRSQNQSDHAGPDRH